MIVATLWRVLSVWIVLTGGMQSLSGCATKLPPPDLTDARGCYVGMVPRSQLVQVQVWAPRAQAGDLLITPACDAAETEQMLNDIRRRTR